MSSSLTERYRLIPSRIVRKFQAVPTGFEPAVSSLTGTHVGPLHHGTRANDWTFYRLS